MLSLTIKACRLLFQESWDIKTIHLVDWTPEIRGDILTWPWEDISLPVPSRPLGNKHLLDKIIYLQQTSITAVCWAQCPPKMADDLWEQCQDIGRALTFDPAGGEISMQLRCVMVLWESRSSKLAWAGPRNREVASRKSPGPKTELLQACEPFPTAINLT